MKNDFPSQIEHFGQFEKAEDGNITVSVQVIDVAEALAGFTADYGVLTKKSETFHSDVVVTGTPNAVADLLSAHYADDFDHYKIDARPYLLGLFAAAA